MTVFENLDVDENYLIDHHGEHLTVNLAIKAAETITQLDRFNWVAGWDAPSDNFKPENSRSFIYEKPI